MRLIKFTFAFLILLTGPVFAYTTVTSLSSNTTWNSGTYYISSSFEDSTHSLTINAGVVVKFNTGVYLKVAAFTVNGTAASPVYFTSKNDNTVGENISGSSGTPAAGDWNQLARAYYGSGTPSLTYAVIRYPSYGWYVHTNNGWTMTFNNLIFKNCGTSAIDGDTGGSGGTTINLNNSQVDTCGKGLNAVAYTLNAKNDLIINNTTYGVSIGYSTSTVKNSTLTGNAIAVRTAGGTPTLTVTDSIIANNTINLSRVDGTLNLNYVNQYNNGSTNSASSNTNAISGNPVFQSGTAETPFIGNIGHFLNQSTSVDLGAGSDTAATLSLDTVTTSVDKTLDSGTVDVGYHYSPDDIFYGAPPGSSLVGGGSMGGGTF